jgi:hypothetical protein
MCCLTSCGDPPRGIPIAPDLTRAKADLCPDTFPAAPALTPLTPFVLPDGRTVVLLDTVIDRETATAHYIINGRQAWYDCHSPVAYFRDWSRLMGIPTSGAK